ncbi:MAG: class I SAM-dependent methyltransferase [Fibrobacter sp.]|jgi:cyclopropane fatty-acyl-phospholipid synthase-like methyltransferase|nr:class I SAM-dependent methyltransferase [Fibrobacter sp.]
MDSKKSIGFWESVASKSDLKSEDTKLGNNVTSAYDCNFILKYANSDSDVLDLGSGGGLIINECYDKVKSIVCVELFEQFSRFIVKSPNISVVNKSISDYQPEQNEKFNLITAFGILQYFNEQEIQELYIKYVQYLKVGGKIIVKQQFGVNETITVQNFSKELGKPYFAQYRTLELEKKILEFSGFKIIEIADIYPPELNKWDNTHFFALVAEKL